MLMNHIEFVVMNNPIRALIQDRVEVKRLRRLSDLKHDKAILEIGCGNGSGTKLVKKYFMPRKIVGVDLDPRMINIARKNNRDRSIEFLVGDAAKLDFQDRSFDAVIDFGIIHHVPNWKGCLNEIKRVLKPNGQLISEDLSIESFNTPFGRIMKRLLRHPYESMYIRDEFLDYLAKLGFTLKSKNFYPFRAVKYFALVAKKSS